MGISKEQQRQIDVDRLNPIHKGLYVYSYQFVDADIDEYSTDPFEDDLSEYNQWLVDSIVALVLGGWEGDGKIRRLWLPPFLFGSNESHGIHVLHVKQHNNGMSFVVAGESLARWLVGLEAPYKFTWVRGSD